MSRVRYCLWHSLIPVTRSMVTSYRKTGYLYSNGARRLWPFPTTCWAQPISIFKTLTIIKSALQTLRILYLCCWSLHIFQINTDFSIRIKQKLCKSENIKIVLYHSYYNKPKIVYQTVCKWRQTVVNVAQKCPNKHWHYQVCEIRFSMLLKVIKIWFWPGSTVVKSNKSTA